MDLAEKVQLRWKTKYLTEIPDEFISRLQCQLFSTNTDNDRGVNKVNIFSLLLKETEKNIKELTEKLGKEKHYFEVLSSLSDDETEENADRKLDQSLQPNGPDDQDSSLYAKVNKVSNSKQTTSESQNDMIATSSNSITAHTERSMYESSDELHCNAEISIKRCTNTGPVRGSIKNKIKLFETNDLSASEKSPGVEGEYAQLKTPNWSPKSTRHERINDYEEISLPMSVQQKAVSLSNPDVPSLQLQSCDNGHTKLHLPTKHDGVTTLSNHKQESDVNKINSKQNAPPIPAKRGKYLEKQDNGNDLKKTELLTLRHSEHEPQVKCTNTPLISNLTGQKAECGEERNFENLYQKTDIDCLADSEGDYCSLKEFKSGTKDKHITYVNVVSIGQKENVSVKSSQPEIEFAGSSESSVIEDSIALKKSPSFSKSVDDLNGYKSFGEYCIIKEITPLSSSNDKMKKQLGHEKSFNISGDKDKQRHEEKVVTLEDKNLNIKGREDSSKILVSSELGKSNRDKKTKPVPHYERWSFEDLVTQEGISVADNDNLTDTGSDGESVADVAVTDQQENSFGQSNVVCEITSTQDEKSQQHEVSLDILAERLDGGDISTTDDPSIISCVTIDTNNKDLQPCESKYGLYDEDKVSHYSNKDTVDKNEDSDEPWQADIDVQKQLRMRHLVVKGILESEKAYLRIIEQLIKAKRYLQTSELHKKDAQGAIAMEDITTIYYKMEDFYQIHEEFIDELENQLANWTNKTQIAPAIKQLVYRFKCYEEYVQNYPKAVETIGKYQKNEETRQLLEDKEGNTKKEETLKLEDVLLKPVQRIQTNHLVLQDLISHTPVDHPDFILLRKALKLSQENLKTYKSLNYDKKEETKHLVKSGFVVEVSQDKKQSRHLRYMLLFDDILICTKYKGSLKQKVGTIKYMWSLPLANLSTHIKGDQQYEQKESLEDLKTKIGSMKCELRDEMLKIGSIKEKAFSIAQRLAARNVEKLKKKIQEQEATLIEGLPRLPLHLSVEEIKQQEGFKQRTFLFSTDYERDDWREALESQHDKCQGMPMVQLTTHNCEELINQTKVQMQINSIGTMLLKKDEDMLYGNLNVTIHKMQGPVQPCDVYCCMEMDSYGHFYKKAQTTVSHFVTDASWNEDFELELDGSQTLRILCYRKQQSPEENVILAKCPLELSMDWLDSKFNEKTIAMNEFCLTISIRHTPASKTLKRVQSKVKTGIFGVKIETTTRREKKTVPSIVTTCVQQIEKRGLHELGIYRVSGVTNDIQKLKQLFDKKVILSSSEIDEADIHAITGLLKLYFRELPEPLFTESQYQPFLQTMKLQNEEGKEKCMLELLHSLPDANYYTIVYIIEHLVRVAAQCAENLMSMENLSTIFGPTFMHPAIKEADVNPLTLTLAAKDASLQSEVIHFFLKLAASSKTLRKSAVVESHLI